MMRIGCQTYSWQMSLPRYQGRIDHIAGVVYRPRWASPPTSATWPGAVWAPSTS
jgi:hypothetical protein